MRSAGGRATLWPMSDQQQTTEQRTEQRWGGPIWADLASSDPDRAQDFYGGVLGWTAHDQGEAYGGYRLFSRGSDLVGGLMRNPADAPPDRWTIFFGVTDARAAADAVGANGGQVLMPPMVVPGQGSMFVAADPSGAVFGGWQPDGMPGFEGSGAAAPSWFELHTREYDASVAFYRAVLGWRTSVMSDTEDFRYTTVVEGDREVAGVYDAARDLGSGAPSHWLLYIAVDDVDAAVARLEERSGSVVRAAEDTPYGRMAVVTDPTGAEFALITPPGA